MNRRNALRSCFALGAAASTSNLAFGRAGQKAASMPIGLPPSEPAVNAHLIVANVEIAGVPALAAILPEGTIDLGALGRHMGIEVPTSCDALAAPPKLTQVRSLLREAQRSGVATRFVVDASRMRRLEAPKDAAPFAHSGAASVSVNHNVRIV